MWQMYNPNPTGRSVGDCVVRALSAVLDIDWEEAFEMLADAAMRMGDMPSSNSVLGAVLRTHGFKRKNIPEYCPECYTIIDFCDEYPTGVYVIGTGTHVVAAINGDYIDAWDSGMERPLYFWYLQ